MNKKENLSESVPVSPPIFGRELRCNRRKIYSFLTKLGESYKKTSDSLKSKRIILSTKRQEKERIWEALKTHSVPEVYEMCNKQIPKDKLNKWRRRALRGDNADNHKYEGHPASPELDEKLFDWFKKRREQHIPVGRKDLWDAAREFLKSVKFREGFKLSEGWARYFAKKHGIIYKLRTNKCKRRLDDMKILFTNFFTDLNKIREEKEYADVWNYDEVGIYFEAGLGKTLDQKGNAPVSVLTLGATSMRMTMILCISASGKIAPPVLLYRNTRFESFELESDSDVFILSNSNGYNHEDLNYTKVLPHFLKYIKEGSLMIYDVCTAHKSSRIDALFQSRQIDTLRIPGGATCLLQPVDCGIGHLVKNEVRKCFLSWYKKSFEEITRPEGRRKKSFKKPTNRQIAEWIMIGCRKLQREEIINSFQLTGITSKEYQKKILEEKMSKYYIKLPIDSKIEESMNLKTEISQ